jgi:AcrR family transcriptional regulator
VEQDDLVALRIRGGALAEREGIGHGTFYRYFENKRDIVDHVIDDQDRRDGYAGRFHALLSEVTDGAELRTPS